MCSPWGGTITFTQQGKQALSNSTCVDVNRTLLKDLMNRKFDLFPGATPMYTISSDLGAILLACTSSGRCIYAVHPKTCRCAMSSCDPCRTSKGVHQLWWWSGVQLYTWVAWAIENSHQLSGMQASLHTASELSITVHMNHSAWLFCWGVWGALWRMWIPCSLSIESKALDLYSPPALDIHCSTCVLNWVDTIFRKWWVATNAASLARKGDNVPITMVWLSGERFNVQVDRLKCVCSMTSEGGKLLLGNLPIV